MAYTIIKNYLSSSKYSIKAPYSMSPIGITVHNTANDASAVNEVKYMVGNNSSTSYHVAIDDMNVVLAIPFNRNAWHAGDGNGNGNRKTIGIEICYSKSGGVKFDEAEKNAAHYIATLLKENNWTTKNVYRHKDWSGKNCPHRTMANGWERFLNMIQVELDKLNGKNTTASTSTQQTIKSLDAWANEVRAGKYGSGHTNREKNLKNAGCPYDYQTVRNRVNELCGVKTSTSTSATKPVVTTPTKTLDDWVNEVKAGKHGSAHANREASLKKAGCPFSYEEVRAKVNASYGVKTTTTTSTPVVKPVIPTKSLDDWAREVMSGKHGSGHANREASLKRSGCTYAYEQVRTRVNELSGVKTVQSTPQKSLDDWAREVKAGKHGNGHSNREKSLKQAGCQYSYSQVRARVNALS